MKIWTYIINNPRIEGTQRGYVVTVSRRGARRGDLNYYHGVDAYSNACACVESVKRGRMVFERDGLVFSVNGRNLVVTRD